MDIQDLASFFMDKRVLKVMDPRFSQLKNTGFVDRWRRNLEKNTPQKYRPTNPLQVSSGEIFVVRKYLGEIFQFLFKH